MKLDEYKSILEQAIADETAAYELYQAIADKTEDQFLKELFAEFAQEELEHKKLLAGYFTADAVQQLTFNPVSDYQVAATVDRPKISLDMKPAEAVALAMKEEEAAMQMYLSLAAASVGEEQKALFQSLADMERGHKTKLEDMYLNMAFPEAW